MRHLRTLLFFDPVAGNLGGFAVALPPSPVHPADGDVSLLDLESPGCRRAISASTPIEPFQRIYPAAGSLGFLLACPASGYAALVWLLALDGGHLLGHQDQAFLISFMIVPLYLVLDQIGHWLVRKTMGTLRKTETDENTTYFKIAMRVVRIIIGVSLVLWLFSVWGVQLPFISRRSCYVQASR